MRIPLLCLAVVTVLAPLTSQGQEKIDNPFKNAKVGDFAAYKLTTSVMGKDIEVTMKQTVTAISDTEATFKATTSFMGFDAPPQTTKVDLTKPFDFTGMAAQGKQAGKFEKTGEGKEKIKVGDKTYDCNWLAGKVTAEVKGKKFESEIKVWYTKMVPLTGMVKMEMKSDFANVLMVLTETGSAKKE